MAEENVNADSAGDQSAHGKFALKRIYMKDISFESPLPFNQRGQAQPNVSQDLNTKVSKVDEQHYEVVLNLTVTVKVEEKVAYLVEVHQAGLFLLSGMEEGKMQHILSTVCPGMLFPYAREAIDSLVVRGGFPALMLPPINFDAIYARAIAESRNKAASKSGAH